MPEPLSLAGRSCTPDQAEALLAEVLAQPLPTRRPHHSVAPGVDAALTSGDDEALYRAIADMTAGLSPIPLTRPGTGRPYLPASVRPGGSEDRDGAASDYDGCDAGEEADRG